MEGGHWVCSWAWARAVAGARCHSEVNWEPGRARGARPGGASPAGACRAESESAGARSRAALVRAHWEMLGCLLWAAGEELPVLGAAGVGGWELGLGRGCWNISEVQKPGKRRSGLLLGLHVEQEEKSFWQVVLERQKVAEQLGKSFGFLAAPVGGWLVWGGLALASSQLWREEGRFQHQGLGGFLQGHEVTGHRAMASH